MSCASTPRRSGREDHGRLNKRARQYLVTRVHRGDVKFARKLTCSRTVIVLDYGGRERAFVYSNTSGRIVSFLAPDAPEVKEWVQKKAALRMAQACRRPLGERG